MIHDEICTYEVAKLAKERGFDVPTHCAYNDNCRKAMYMELCLNRNTKDSHSISAPTQSLLQRWLREEKRVNICIDNDLDFDDEKFVYEWQITEKENFDNGGFEIHRYNSDEPYPSYELALEDALAYSLKNLV